MLSALKSSLVSISRLVDHVLLLTHAGELFEGQDEMAARDQAHAQGSSANVKDARKLIWELGLTRAGLTGSQAQVATILARLARCRCGRPKTADQELPATDDGPDDDADDGDNAGDQDGAEDNDNAGNGDISGDDDDDDSDDEPGTDGADNAVAGHSPTEDTAKPDNSAANSDTSSAAEPQPRDSLVEDRVLASPFIPHPPAAWPTDSASSSPLSSPLHSLSPSVSPSVHGSGLEDRDGNGSATGPPGDIDSSTSSNGARESVTGGSDHEAGTTDFGALEPEDEATQAAESDLEAKDSVESVARSTSLADQPVAVGADVDASTDEKQDPLATPIAQQGSAAPVPTPIARKIVVPVVPLGPARGATQALFAALDLSAAPAPGMVPASNGPSASTAVSPPGPGPTAMAPILTLTTQPECPPISASASGVNAGPSTRPSASGRAFKVTKKCSDKAGAAATRKRSREWSSRWDAQARVSHRLPSSPVTPEEVDSLGSSISSLEIQDADWDGAGDAPMLEPPVEEDSEMDDAVPLAEEDSHMGPSTLPPCSHLPHDEEMLDSPNGIEEGDADQPMDLSGSNAATGAGNAPPSAFDLGSRELPPRQKAGKGKDTDESPFPGDPEEEMMARMDQAAKRARLSEAKQETERLLREKERLLREEEREVRRAKDVAKSYWPDSDTDSDGMCRTKTRAQLQKEEAVRKAKVKAKAKAKRR